MFHWKVSTALVGVCLFVLNHFIYSSRAKFKADSSSPETAGKLSWARTEDHSQNLLQGQGHVWWPMTDLSPLCIHLNARKKVSKYKNWTDPHHAKAQYFALTNWSLHAMISNCIIYYRSHQISVISSDLRNSQMKQLHAGIHLHRPSFGQTFAFAGPAQNWYKVSLDKASQLCTEQQWAIVYKSLRKGERLKGSYSSPQRCQSPVPPPSWTWGRCLAGAACWQSGAPSASWSSLPSADPTGLHNKREIKESVSKTKHLVLHFLVKELTAQALSSRLHYCCSGQPWHALTSTAWVPQTVSAQSKSQLQLCDPQIKPALGFTVPKDSLQMEVWYFNSSDRKKMAFWELQHLTMLRGFPAWLALHCHKHTANIAQT